MLRVGPNSVVESGSVILWRDEPELAIEIHDLTFVLSIHSGPGSGAIEAVTKKDALLIVAGFISLSLGFLFGRSTS
jgi:hypothetical protein